MTEEDVIAILDLTDGQPDPVAINQRIIMHVFINCQSHSELLNASNILEELVEPLKQATVHELHRGMHLLHVYILYNCNFL